MRDRDTTFGARAKPRPAPRGNVSRRHPLAPRPGHAPTRRTPEIPGLRSVLNAFCAGIGYLNRPGSQSDSAGMYVTSNSTAIDAPKNGHIVFIASRMVILPTA